jgi:adenine phosphoribosyltransferase
VRVSKVAGIEARGFILAAPVAVALGVGFVPVRKAGKLPGETLTQSYALEYGEATLEIPADALDRDDQVLVVDDVLATGGTVEATAQLVGRTGASVRAVAVLIELAFLGGRDRLPGLDLTALTTI